MAFPRYGNLKQKGGSSMESIAQYKRDETWAPTEKKLARIAFDKAFERQCTAITQEARRILETTTAPSDIFRVQEYLTEQRKIVDGLYDYRYSRLLGVFGRLLSDGWLREGDLHGLQPEKIAQIKHEAIFLLRVNFSPLSHFPQPKTGSIPILSLTASRNRCLQPRYFSVVCTKTWPNRN